MTLRILTAARGSRSCATDALARLVGRVRLNEYLRPE